LVGGLGEEKKGKINPQTDNVLSGRGEKDEWQKINTCRSNLPRARFGEGERGKGGSISNF